MLDAGTNSLILLCAHVLTNEGRCRQAQGVGNHINEGVDLPGSREGCHGDRTEAIDVGLNHHVGEGYHHGLDSCRNTDVYDTQEHILVEADLGRVELIHFLCVDQII